MRKGLFIFCCLVCLLWLSECSVFDPESVYINKISLDIAPTHDADGYDWDELSEPDFFYILYDEDDRELRRGDAFQDQTPSEETIEWTLSSPLKITDFNKKYYIAIYDEDVLENDYVSDTGYFTMNDAYESDSFAIESDLVTITLELEWEYPF